MATEMQVVANELVVTYKKVGQGPLFVLLPDMLQSVDALDTLIQELVETVTVVVVYPPGMGGSQAPKKTWNTRKLATHTRDALQKMSIMQNDITILAGYGAGGKIAIECVAKQLLQPKKMLLLCTDAGPSTSYTLMGRLFSKHRTHEGSFSDKWQQKTFEKIAKKSVYQEAERIALPTLIMHAELDQKISLATSQALQHAVSGSELRIVQHATHDLSGSQEESARMIRQFINA